MAHYKLKDQLRENWKKPRNQKWINMLRRYLVDRGNMWGAYASKFEGIAVNRDGFKNKEACKLWGIPFVNGKSWWEIFDATFSAGPMAINLYGGDKGHKDEHWLACKRNGIWEFRLYKENTPSVTKTPQTHKEEYIEDLLTPLQCDLWRIIKGSPFALMDVLKDPGKFKNMSLSSVQKVLSHLPK